MPKRKPKILIIEDEVAIRTGLADLLVYHGFDPDCEEDGLEGLRKASSGIFDLILLDVMLPSMNGFEVLEHIREKDRELPVIMLTAKSSDDDIVQGLRLGADDYVAKPFSVAQLTLRIQAVLRRSDRGIGSPDMLVLDQAGGRRIQIDTKHLSGKMSWDSGTEVAFTRREMEVLIYLYEKNNRPVPREELLTRVWGYAPGTEIETRTVDIHIAKIRRKIEPDPGSPEFLITLRGAGYKLITDADEQV